MHTPPLKPFTGFILLTGSLALATLSTATADQISNARPKYIPKPTDFAIVCTVYKSPLKDRRVALPDVPITYDARISIGALVERLEFGRAPWPVGTRVNFLTI
jgi:hypothetical protein